MACGSAMSDDDLGLPDADDWKRIGQELNAEQPMSTATERMRQYVWPEIQAMMLNHAHSLLLWTAAQVTEKFRGPTARLLQEGYLTYQIVSIRRLCDKSDDVYSLHAALEQAEKESPDFYPQIAALKAFLHVKCQDVYEQVDKHIAHTANPA